MNRCISFVFAVLLLSGGMAWGQPLVPNGGSGGNVTSTAAITAGDLVVGAGGAAIQDASAFTGPAAAPKGININTATGLNIGLQITQTGSGTPGAAQGNLDAGWNFNTITATDQGVNTSGLPAGTRTINALNVAYLGNGTNGIGEGILSTVNIFGVPTATTNALNQFVAGQFIGQTSVNMHGTDTGNGAVGAIFGLGASALAVSGATNLLNVSNELNAGIYTGGSSKSKSILSLAGLALDAVPGAVYDTELSLSNITGARGYNNGILFSDYNGQHPTTSTGTLIATQGAYTTGNGIDFSSYTFSTNFLNSAGFSVSGTGNTTALSFAPTGSTCSGSSTWLYQPAANQLGLCIQGSGLFLYTGNNVTLINAANANGTFAGIRNQASGANGAMEFQIGNNTSATEVTMHLNGSGNSAGNGINSFTINSVAGMWLQGNGNTGIAINASGGVQFGSATLATLSTGELGLPKISASGTAPTAGFLKIEAVAGTNAGTCKVIAYAGTSTTPVTIVDNVGGSC